MTWVEKGRHILTVHIIVQYLLTIVHTVANCKISDELETVQKPFWTPGRYAAATVRRSTKPGNIPKPLPKTPKPAGLSKPGKTDTSKPTGPSKLTKTDATKQAGLSKLKKPVEKVGKT